MKACIDRCPKHPKYKAVLAPRCNCDYCWELYRQRQLNNFTAAQLQGPKAKP